MRTELIYWIVSAPCGIVLIVVMLGELLSVPDSVTEVVGLILFVIYGLSLVLIVVTLARRPAAAVDEFFHEHGFDVQRTRLLGRLYAGTWNGVPVEVRFLVGAGGFPSQLEARRPPNEAWYDAALEPVVLDRVGVWLDRITTERSS